MYPIIKKHNNKSRTPRTGFNWTQRKKNQTWKRSLKKIIQNARESNRKQNRKNIKEKDTEKSNILVNKHTPNNYTLSRIKVK